MTLHQLRIFLAVAQASTLTRASKQLGLAQPSLSKQLSSLEENVGARLFERAHKRMVLTDAGRLLLFHAQRVIRGIDEAEAGLREFTSGTSISCHRIAWSRIAAPTRSRSGSCARASV